MLLCAAGGGAGRQPLPPAVQANGVDPMEGTRVLQGAAPARHSTPTPALKAF